MTSHHTNCNCKSSSLSQTLDEMDFTRSIHFNCLNNQFSQLQNKLTKNPQLINTTDSYGYTPLHYAAKKGNLEICKYLVEKGACVHLVTKGQGTTALHRACLDNHVEVIIYLIEQGSNPLLNDFDHRTPMSILEEKVKMTSENNSDALKQFRNYIKLNWNWNSENITNKFFLLNQPFPVFHKTFSFNQPIHNTTLNPMLEIQFNQLTAINRLEILSNSKLIEIYHKPSNNNQLTYIQSIRFTNSIEVDSKNFYIIQLELDSNENNYENFILKFLSLPANSKSELKLYYIHLDIDESQLTIQSNNKLESNLIQMMNSNLTIKDDLINQPSIELKIAQLENHIKLLELKFQNDINLIKNEIEKLKN